MLGRNCDEHTALTAIKGVTGDIGNLVFKDLFGPK